PRTKSTRADIIQSLAPQPIVEYNSSLFRYHPTPKLLEQALYPTDGISVAVDDDERTGIAATTCRTHRHAPAFIRFLQHVLAVQQTGRKVKFVGIAHIAISPCKGYQFRSKELCEQSALVGRQLDLIQYTKQCKNSETLRVWGSSVDNAASKTDLNRILKQR